MVKLGGGGVPLGGGGGQAIGPQNNFGKPYT